MLKGSFLGVSLNGGFPPISHPKMIIFGRKKPMVAGETHHFRVHPQPNHADPVVKRQAFFRLEESSLSKCKLVRRALGLAGFPRGVTNTFGGILDGSCHEICFLS